jgi:hypothetical protein
VSDEKPSPGKKNKKIINSNCMSWNISDIMYAAAKM